MFSEYTARGNIHACAISVTGTVAPLLTRLSITPPMSGMPASARAAISTDPGSAWHSVDLLLGTLIGHTARGDRQADEAERCTGSRWKVGTWKAVLRRQ